MTGSGRAKQKRTESSPNDCLSFCCFRAQGMSTAQRHQQTGLDLKVRMRKRVFLFGPCFMFSTIYI
jgi:hypothetical protein